MELMDIIRARRSVRSYLADKVDAKLLYEIMEAGRLAPSAVNQQKWKFIAVTDPALQAEMAHACFDQPCMAGAPASITVCTCADRVMSCGQQSGTVDSCIAMSFMILRARELGLGTCWLGHFDAEKAAQVLGLDEGWTAVAVTPVGYPAEQPAPRPRKTIEEVAEVR